MSHFKSAAKGRVFSKAIWGAAILSMTMGLANSRRAAVQVLYGSLVGGVTDPSGAAVPGATVTVTQAETQFTRSVTTDSSGTYSLSTLKAGTYEVKISAPGFKT
jgi:protocatechuate 3,4-dioxygenase beta subunit